MLREIKQMAWKVESPGGLFPPPGGNDADATFLSAARNKMSTIYPSRGAKINLEPATFPSQSPSRDGREWTRPSPVSRGG